MKKNIFQHVISRILSISIKKIVFVTPLFISVTSYFSLHSARSGQYNKQCFNVCISVLQGHKRYSLGIYGFLLPVSIFKLWEPVLYLVMHTLSNSKISLYLGVDKSWFTWRYEPNFESLSNAASDLILSTYFLLSSSLRIWSQTTKFSNRCCRSL